jgi:hypothetical protein
MREKDALGALPRPHGSTEEKRMKSGFIGRKLPLLLVPFCALFLVHCGESDTTTQCVPSFLKGGSYSFLTRTVNDGCAGGLLAGLVPAGPYVMDLPPVSALPATITVDLPFVGEVEADLSLSGNLVEIVTDPPEISGTVEYLGMTVSYEASVRGVLCPTAPTLADVNLEVNLISLDPAYFAVPCKVVIILTGGL